MDLQGYSVSIRVPYTSYIRNATVYLRRLSIRLTVKNQLSSVFPPGGHPCLM